jgi:hypothetical protein
MGMRPAKPSGVTVALDPCNLIPDSVIPAGLPLRSQHAIHHVVGRIRHRVRPHPVHAKLAHVAPNADGCERTAKLGPTLLRATPAGSALTGPALAAISGAGGAAIGGFGGYTAGRATKEHKHGDHGHDGRTPVPEPASAFLFVSAVPICLVWRHFLRRPTAPQPVQS